MNKNKILYYSIMISTVLKSVFVGGAKRAIIPISGSPGMMLLVGIIIAVIDLMVRGLILEYGYNLLIKKMKINAPKLDLMECLILIIIVMSLFRN